MANKNQKSFSSTASQTPSSTNTPPTPAPTPVVQELQQDAAATEQTLEQGTDNAATDTTSAGDSASDSDTTTTTTTDTAAGDEQTLIVEPVQLQVQEPVVVETTPAPVVVEASAPVSENADVTARLALILKDVPGANQTDINRVVMYIERMKPGRPVDAHVGGKEQIALYRSIQNIINRQDDHFTQLFTALLYLFEAYSDGALGDRYRMRFMESVQMHAGDRKAFAYLSQLLHILADPKSRDIAIKQINMELALQNGLTADGRTRVLNYFNV
jgi:hypothetical protein